MKRTPAIGTWINRYLQGTLRKFISILTNGLLWQNRATAYVHRQCAERWINPLASALNLFPRPEVVPNAVRRLYVARPSRSATLGATSKSLPNMNSLSLVSSVWSCGNSRNIGRISGIPAREVSSMLV